MEENSRRQEWSVDTKKYNKARNQTDILQMVNNNKSIAGERSRFGGEDALDFEINNHTVNKTTKPAPKKILLRPKKVSEEEHVSIFEPEPKPVKISVSRRNPENSVDRESFVNKKFVIKSRKEFADQDDILI